MAASDQPREFRMEKRAEPSMMQTMKQLKTMPRGVAPVSSTGVHRNTKMYMQKRQQHQQNQQHQ